jgi:hypothetical protein
MKQPYIFIFDLDVIIGNTILIRKEFDILNIIHLKCKKENILNKCIDNYDITEELENGLLRPKFKEFITFIKTKYKNPEFYIYSTNYTIRWINSGIISNIEKICNMKFNKPYLIDIYSTDIITNLINDNLISKYPSLKNPKNKLIYFTIYTNNIFEKNKLVTPVYNYKYYYDIKSKLINKYHIKEEAFDNEELLTYFNQNELPIYNKNGSVYQQDKQFQLLKELILIRQIEIDNDNGNEKGKGIDTDNYFTSLSLNLSLPS